MESVEKKGSITIYFKGLCPFFLDKAEKIAMAGSVLVDHHKFSFSIFEILKDGPTPRKEVTPEKFKNASVFNLKIDEENRTPLQRRSSVSNFSKDRYENILDVEKKTQKSGLDFSKIERRFYFRNGEISVSELNSAKSDKSLEPIYMHILWPDSTWEKSYISESIKVEIELSKTGLLFANSQKKPFQLDFQKDYEIFFENQCDRKEVEKSFDEDVQKLLAIVAPKLKKTRVVVLDSIFDYLSKDDIRAVGPKVCGGPVFSKQKAKDFLPSGGLPGGL